MNHHPTFDSPSLGFILGLRAIPRVDRCAANPSSDCPLALCRRWLVFAASVLICLPGCNFIPDIKHKPQFHNPFPQISKVAILPFRNQSQEPTLSGSRVSLAYYNELQAINGFEVLPCGVVENQLAFFESQVLRHPAMTPVDFQQFAKHLGVDAVLQGAITDYDAYYPPRITLKVNWYAANPGFHPIPVGYGLPWGTKKEKKIPEWIRLESERSLAIEQMKTQTPQEVDSETPVVVRKPAGETSTDNLRDEALDAPQVAASTNIKEDRIAAARIRLPNLAIPNPVSNQPDDEGSRVVQATASQEPDKIRESVEAIAIQKPNPDPVVELSATNSEQIEEPDQAGIPANWPDPQGFIPRQPTSQPPQMKPQFEPIISHMRTYNGNDEDFTRALEEYYYFRDDARFGGWQSYLQRSEDFIRFCCHKHIVETLESRGGSLESRMILRWPINRYER